MDITRSLGGGGVAFKGASIVEDETAKRFLLTLIEELENGQFHDKCALRKSGSLA
jgi:hypothetical protein